MRLQRDDAPTGLQFVKGADVEVRIHFVATRNDKTIFYQSIIELEKLNEREFIQHGALAFPKLHFVEGIDKQFRRFQQNYDQVRADVAHHLAVLNNHFRRLLDEHRDLPTVCQIMSSQHGVEMSSESPNTRRNRGAMKEREVEVDCANVICEMHTKLTPTHDRIYFHPGKAEVTDGLMSGQGVVFRVHSYIVVCRSYLRGNTIVVPR